jgi:hypothetical protein
VYLRCLCYYFRDKAWIHTYTPITLTPWRGSRGTFHQNYLTIRNTADVTGGNAWMVCIKRILKYYLVEVLTKNSLTSFREYNYRKRIQKPWNTWLKSFGSREIARRGSECSEWGLLSVPPGAREPSLGRWGRFVWHQAAPQLPLRAAQRELKALLIEIMVIITFGSLQCIFCSTMMRVK